MTGTFSSPLELLALGSGHHPAPQILTQDQAVICSSSGCSPWPGRGCTLEAQHSGPGPQVACIWPTRNFLMKEPAFKNL